MQRVHIQACGKQDLREVRQWLAARQSRCIPYGKLSLERMMQDECLLLARKVVIRTTGSRQPGKLTGLAGLDLDSGRVQLLALDSYTCLPELLAATERLAVDFGMQTLALLIRPSKQRALDLPGYRSHEESAGLLQRNLGRRLSAHARKALLLNTQLGIPVDYGRRHRLRLQAEPRELASIGLDVFEREQFMLPDAAQALLQLIRSAAGAGVVVQAVSAFRSVGYQANLIRNKVDKGQSMADILRVSAAPGYSEHHSGRAVDLTTPGCKPLEEEFADTDAYAWLNRHAREFGFRLSYPQGNRHGVSYEPWHWYFSG